VLLELIISMALREEAGAAVQVLIGQCECASV